MAKIKAVNLNANGVLDNLKSTINSNIKEETGKQVKSYSSKSINTETGNTEKEYSNKPVNVEKKKKNKCNYMLTDDTLTQLLELQLYTVKIGKKRDFSSLVTEAINDLYKKYLCEK